ncbi:PKD domain-containing protein [Aeromonas sp. FDAARGOS 1409]|uniref:PKD domain-containing protein n=1 Tax=Aeromonas TaxID=642 RepID=UPI001C23C782|nr:PKD domain-containing protein [Aeromonas sp. FDAARGOS 1409]QXC28460.1 PKD domain-containing protein [Aeromonas sp. FDAARGOS 1409]
MLGNLDLFNLKQWRMQITGMLALMAMLSISPAMAVESTSLNGEPPPISVAQSQLGQSVPASVIVLHNGLEWVWASPCAQGGCTAGIDVGHDGFVFATAAQWALRPPVAAFTGKCASPWFDHTWDHCDVGDALLNDGTGEGNFYGFGTVGSAPSGGLPAGFDGTLPMNSVGETWLVRIPNDPPVADANGPYVVPVLGTTPFDGSGSSDPDGDPLTYAWTADGGTLDDNMAELPTYTAGAVPGIYDVTLVVNDGTVDSESSATTVVVYDPKGGFVTGGGWIDSPEAAYKLDESLTGKANFGFVSKYLKGATVPSGSTQFNFQVGNLNFHSNVYEWLVVNQNGHNAQYKGTGTINGTGSYGFMLWAGDNGTTGDSFRIKIWNKGDNDSLVYDNGVDQQLGGGQVVIHIK